MGKKPGWLKRSQQSIFCDSSKEMFNWVWADHGLHMLKMKDMNLRTDHLVNTFPLHSYSAGICYCFSLPYITVQGLMLTDLFGAYQTMVFKCKQKSIGFSYQVHAYGDTPKWHGVITSVCRGEGQAMVSLDHNRIELQVAH